MQNEDFLLLIPGFVNEEVYTKFLHIGRSVHRKQATWSINFLLADTVALWL